MSIGSLNQGIRDLPQIRANVSKNDFNANVKGVLNDSKITKSESQQLSKSVTGGEKSITDIIKSVHPSEDFETELSSEKGIILTDNEKTQLGSILDKLDKENLSTKAIASDYVPNSNSSTPVTSKRTDTITSGITKQGNQTNVQKGDISLVQETAHFGGKTLYLNSEEARSKYKIDFQEKAGQVLLYQKDNQGKISPMDTAHGRDITMNSEEGRFIFVMDKAGNMYSANMLDEFNKMDRGNVTVDKTPERFKLETGKPMTTSELIQKTSSPVTEVIKNDKGEESFKIIAPNGSLFKEGQIVSKKDLDLDEQNRVKDFSSLEFTRSREVFSFEKTDSVITGYKLESETPQSKRFNIPINENISLEAFKELTGTPKKKDNGDGTFTIEEPKGSTFKKDQVVTKDQFEKDEAERVTALNILTSYTDVFESTKDDITSTKDENPNNPQSNPNNGLRFHHSTFLGGQDVAGAGTIKTSQGKVSEISDNSGHYRPDASKTIQVVNKLEESQVKVESVNVKLSGKKDNEKTAQVSAIKLQAHRNDQNPEQQIRSDLSKKAEVLKGIGPAVEEMEKRKALKAEMDSQLGMLDRLT